MFLSFSCLCYMGLLGASRSRTSLLKADDLVLRNLTWAPPVAWSLAVVI